METGKSAHTKRNTNSHQKKKKGKNASSNEIFTYRIGQDLSMVIPRISEGRGK